MMRPSLDKHGSADFDQLQQILRVPVSQAETTMRLGAPDLFGMGRAVNAVAGSVQADPDGANRIVRAGLEEQLVIEFAGLSGFGKKLRIKGVVGIERSHRDVQFA